MTIGPDREPHDHADLEKLLTWRESSTSGSAISAALEVGRAAAGVREILRASDQVVLTGAGSSYYIAQAAATAAREITRRPYVAAPLSEVLLRTSGVLAGGEPDRRAVVVISRSGSTSEAVLLAERLTAVGHPVVAVTCREGSPLSRAALMTLVSPVGDEEAIVMTRSFASMLALLLRIVADLGDGGRIAADLDLAPGHWAQASAAAMTGRRLGASDWSRIVILAGGPAFGIASEWSLKLTETSQVATSVYEPLEFRHGPISVCEPGVLVVGLLGGAPAVEEGKVISEAAHLGARTWVLAGDAAETAGLTGDVSLIGNGLDPIARLPLLVHPAHALALALALTRGRNPDAPRHLGQVVRLDLA
jgi:glucosamine--fructose-6-phosphate aminotransferase (isomerizing)